MNKEMFQDGYPNNVIFDIFKHGVSYRGELIDPTRALYYFNAEGFGKAIDTLFEREQEAIIQFYKNGLTKKDIAEKFGVSHQRGCQVVENAKTKLRQPMRISMYYDDPIKKESQTLRIENDIRRIADALEIIANVLDPSKQIKSKSTISTSVLITDLNFSVRAFNVLLRNGIETIGDLIARSESDVMKFRNLGRRTYEEITDKLLDRGLRLKKDDD